MGAFALFVLILLGLIIVGPVLHVVVWLTIDLIVSIFFWMRRIAINRAIDVYRAYKRQRRLRDLSPIEETIERTMSTPPPQPDRAPEVAETRAQVDASLEKLSPRYARALRLRLIEDRDREECAELMEVSLGNFDVILHRACKSFRKVYPP